MKEKLSGSIIGSGHRQRLRAQFAKDSGSLSQIDLLELLLSYAIPRVNVKPLAQKLMSRFGSIQNVISSSSEDLLQVNGVGEQVLTFLKLLERINMSTKEEDQPSLFHDLPVRKNTAVTHREKHVFTDDETRNTIQFLPQVIQYSSLDEYRQYLQTNLPYNSESTRIRRMNYILHRFFPDNSLDIPLVYFLSKSKSQKALKSIVFYSILKAEPLPQKIASELIYPNLPLGFVRRSQMDEFIRTLEPDLKNTSIEKALIAINKLYLNSDMAIAKDNRLIFHLQNGDLEAFLYIFSAEFSTPGMYTFEDLYQTPVHRWMLWDKDWMHSQLYNLRELGIISKISEIDTINQFTVGLNQVEALKRFYENPQSTHMVLRENNHNLPMQGE